MNKIIYLACACRSEILVAEDVVDEFPTGSRREVNISIFNEYCKNGKYSFWDRLKYVWRVLTTGEPHTDQIILNEEEARKLKEWLITKELEHSMKQHGVENGKTE